MVALGVSLTGCAPAFDWRELTLANTGIAVRLPCRPSTETRPLATSDGVPAVDFSLRSCDVDGVWFGVGHAALDDPANVDQWLKRWDAAVAQRFAVSDPEDRTWTPPGCTPHPATVWRTGAGHLPDGRPVSVTWLLFAYGPHIVQATAYGEQMPEDVVRTYAAGLHCGG